MNTHRQVGKTFANFPPFSIEVGKLADACQLQTIANQGVGELSADWQFGRTAKLPTFSTPHKHWDSTPFEVGENSPSYYVGEGPEGPSTLRGGFAGHSDSGHQSPFKPSVLALDLGTQTGWAVRDRSGVVTSGSESFKPQRFEGGGMRYLRFRRWLTELKQCCDGMDAVYFEEVRRHAGVDAAHAYGGFMAHLTAWCEHHQIPYQGVPVGTIKKHATGKGNASKAEMIAAAKRCGFEALDDNHADALALLDWAIVQGGESCE